MVGGLNFLQARVDRCCRYYRFIYFRGILSGNYRNQLIRWKEIKARLDQEINVCFRVGCIFNKAVFVLDLR